MKHTTVRPRPPAPPADAQRRQLADQVARLERRLATLANVARATDAELRRQRACGRRP